MANDSWIDKDYKVPTSGTGYMKFKEGDNLVRILAKPVMGYELWIDGKPVRRKKDNFTAAERASADINKYTGKPKTPQHFWAMPVYNYDEKRVMWLNASQQSVQNGLLSLLRNPKWGTLDQYDVIITKDKNIKPPYSVQPDPKSPLSKEAKAAWSAVTVDAEEYFKGGHPLNSKDASTFSEEEVDDLIEG